MAAGGAANSKHRQKTSLQGVALIPSWSESRETIKKGNVTTSLSLLVLCVCKGMTLKKITSQIGVDNDYHDFGWSKKKQSQRLHPLRAQEIIQYSIVLHHYSWLNIIEED